MTSSSKDSSDIVTVTNAAQILHGIKEMQGATLTELSSNLDMATSTVYDYFSTLENLGYIVQRDNQYYLGLKFYEYGIQAKNAFNIVELAKPVMDRAAEETGETVWLIVEENGQACGIERSTGEKSVPMQSDLGTLIPIHSIASGKAILAHYSEEKVEEIINKHGLESRTDYTITEREELYEEFEEIRSQGYAINDQESINGLRSIGAPIFREDEVVAAFDIAGPVHRLDDDKLKNKISKILLQSVNEVELKIEYE